MSELIHLLGQRSSGVVTLTSCATESYRRAKVIFYNVDPLRNHRFIRKGHHIQIYFIL